MILSKASRRWERLCRFVVLLLVVFGCIAVGYFGRYVLDLWRIATKIRSAVDNQDRYVHRLVNRAHESGISTNTSHQASLTSHHVVHPPSNYTKMNANCAPCSVGFCSPDNEPDLSFFSAAATEIHVFFNYTFNCHGEITAWKLLDQNPSAGKSVYLDVLKYDQPKDEGTWMGFNKILTSGAAGWVTYEIPEAERVKVEPGLFVGFHYDDIAADPVVPFIDATTAPPGMQLSDGFTILMDHQELNRVAKVGRVAEVPMTKLFHNLLISPKTNWRSPALAAIVRVTSGKI